MRVPAIGPVRQMEFEQQEADALGLPWTASFYCPATVTGSVCTHPRRPGGWATFKRDYFRWLEERVADFDLLFLRYASVDPFEYRFVRNATLPIVTGHHTLEVNELSISAGWKSGIKAAAERHLGPLTLAHAIGHVGVTNEIAAHARDRAAGSRPRPAILYSNGVSYEEGGVLPAALSGNRHEVIFMSSRFSPWAGLDLLVDAVRRSKRDLVVHVVGSLEPAQRDAVYADQRLVAHGHLEPAAIDELMARSTVGLGALALHRNRMNEGSTLKVRTYLRAGLPVYSGYRDVFDERFPYYREGPVDIDQLLSFADSMRDVDRRTVSEVARPLIDKRILLRGLYDELSALVR